MATTKKLQTDLQKLKQAYERQSTPADLKSKLKAQIDKVEAELKKVKTEKKEKPSATVAASTQVLLGKLQKFVSKNSKKYGSYSGRSESSLEKDAVRHALKIGKRTSQGIKGNQFKSKSESKGHTYYEYRVNRHDVKQPKAKQSYPILAKGGKLSEADVKKVWNTYLENEDNNAHSENVVLLAKNFGSKDDIKKAEDILKKHDEQGHITYEQQQERHKISDKLYPMLVAKAEEAGVIMESGGYMAKGGSVDSRIKQLEKRIKENEEALQHGHLDNYEKDEIMGLIQELREQRNDLIDERNKKDLGGYMAKGGGVDKIYILESTTPNGQKTVVAKFKLRSDALSCKNHLNNLDKKIKHEIIESREKFESGGYMAKGGVAEHKLMVGDYIKSIVGSDHLMVINNGKVYSVDIERGERKLMQEDGGFLDVSLDKGAGSITNIGGTTFSSADTSDMFKMGGTVKFLKHRKDK